MLNKCSIYSKCITEINTWELRGAKIYASGYLPQIFLTCFVFIADENQFYSIIFSSLEAILDTSLVEVQREGKGMRDKATGLRKHWCHRNSWDLKAKSRICVASSFEAACSQQPMLHVVQYYILFNGILAVSLNFHLLTHLFLLSSGKGTLGTYCEPGAVLGTEETSENGWTWTCLHKKFLKKWRWDMRVWWPCSVLEVARRFQRRHLEKVTFETRRIRSS